MLSKVLSSCAQFLTTTLLTITLVNVIIVCTASVSLNAQPTKAKQHPLSVPTVTELEQALNIMRSDSRWPAHARIVTLDIREPNKREVLRNPGSVPREMMAVIHDVVARTTFEFTADLGSSTVSEVRRIEGMQPMIYTDDMDSVMSILRSNERWKSAIARRGLADSNIAIDVWASGVPTSAFPDRMARGLAFVKKNGINAYDQPVEGLAALVNVSKRSVVEIVDRPSIPLAEPNTFMRANLVRAKDKPRAKVAANKNIRMDGNLVEWGPWTFRYQVHAREGLTIYQLAYNKRSIAYRMSLSEMVVPYGDTAAHWRWRSAFDVGEYGIGTLAAPLIPGKDVPENAFLTGMTAVAANGDVTYRDNMMAIYEADAGMAWKHYDVMSGAHMVARGRELVITQTSTVGNYDYALSWIFTESGAIVFDAALTGILLTKGTVDTVYAGAESNQKYAHYIDKNLLAPSHQHFFNLRLDMDVDDTANAVSEIDLVTRPVGSENPFGNAIMMDDWEFRYEREATTSADASVARTWKISSTIENSLGMPTAYTLIPHAGPTSFLHHSNLVRRRAAFMTHDLWVTRHHEEELFGAGAYPNQSNGDDGLPTYISNNESVLRRDVVLWYTFNVTHLARPEDWPIMPAAHAGFKIIPTGFFTQNPTTLQPTPSQAPGSNRRR